jgi:BirA family biotin operon repressor/biotin-[acetyl-CoA-carboxylase] ligase
VAGLSLAVGVAVLRALARAGFSHASLKWPNDLLCDGAKLGGILLDVAGEMHGQCTVVVGLGLNRHVPDSAAAGIDQAWTDLGRVVQGPPPARNALIALLLNEMLPLLHEYSEQGLLPYLPEWRRAHAYQGREASLHMGDTVIHGRIADVTDDGLLLLELEDGSQRPFASGDVRLRVSRS